MIINPSMMVGEIAEQYPETLPILAQYRIDVGHERRRALAEVARAQGIDLKRLIEELLAARLVGA